MTNQSQTITIPLLAVLGIGMILSITSCKGVDIPDTTYSYLYHKNSKIDVDTTQSTTKSGTKQSVLHFSVQKGNKLVFIYKK